MKPLVGIIMGSQSDWETMQAADEMLDGARRRRTKCASSRRIAPPTCCSSTPRPRRTRGLEVIIAGAGGAAHLPGMTAAKTRLPVLGVPVQSKTLNGIDSLLSIVQMPKGVPVATFAIGEAGAANAALFAAAIVALARHQPSPRRWSAIRRAQTEAVLARPDPAPGPMTIGVLGAGQLGRMMALAGYPLGMDFLFLDREPGTPANQVAPSLFGDFADPELLDELAARCEVVTFDWENVPAEALERLAGRTRIAPPRAALATAQDRFEEKSLFRSLSIPTNRTPAGRQSRGPARGRRRDRPARRAEDPAPGLRRQGPVRAAHRRGRRGGLERARQRAAALRGTRRPSTTRSRSSACAASAARSRSIR